MFPGIQKNKDPGVPKGNNDETKTRKKYLLKDLHEPFIKYKLHAVGTAQATIKNYRHNFQLLLQFKPDISTDELNEELIVNFMEFLNTRYRKVGKKQVVRVYKNSSIATVRGKLNTFFEWLIDRGYILNNPFHKIKYPDVSYTDPRAFSPREFESICYAVNTRINWNSLLLKKRNIAIVMFLTFTGVRKEELLGLQIKDIDFERSFIKIRAETSKSKRSRLIPINPQLISYLQDYLIFRKDYITHFFWVSGNQDRGFTEHGAKHFIDYLSKTTNINCHLHRFRHTFATNYYKQTHDLVGLQKLMGHRSFKMTLSYLRSMPEEHLVEQIKKLTVDDFI
jgi:site-specific recombinase XerD